MLKQYELSNCLDNLKEFDSEENNIHIETAKSNQTKKKSRNVNSPNIPYPQVS